MKDRIKKWLGIDSLDERIDTIETLILHEKSRLNGFAVLKPEIMKTNVKYQGKDL